MDVNSINHTQLNLPQLTKDTLTETQITTEGSTTPSTGAETAAVYEAGDQDETLLTDTGYKVNMKKVKAMKADTDQRMVELFRDTVQSGLGKQIRGMKRFTEFVLNTDVQSAMPNAGVSEEDVSRVSAKYDANNEPLDLEVTDANVAKAQADVAEDGYWGAEAVSDRFLEFAIALSGGDRSKSNLLMQAIKDGYKAAEEIWGSELPQLSKDTLALTMDKFEAWRDGEDIAQAVPTTET